MPSDNDKKPLFPFKSPEFLAKWEEWEQYRRERHLPAYKPLGLKKVVQKLLRDSKYHEQTAIDMIEQAMGNYWIGIYPLQKNYYGTTGNNQSTERNKGTSSDRINRAKDW